MQIMMNILGVITITCIAFLSGVSGYANSQTLDGEQMAIENADMSIIDFFKETVNVLSGVIIALFLLMNKNTNKRLDGVQEKIELFIAEISTLKAQVASLKEDKKDG